MYNSNRYKDAALYRQMIMDSARKEYARAKQKRTMAAITDFATNLLSIMGYNKGVQYDVTPRPQSAAAAAKFELAKERYLKTISDYGGAIAAAKLKAGRSGGGDSTPLIRPAHNSVPLPAPYRKKDSKGSEDIISKIRNIQTPVWLINNNKK